MSTLAARVEHLEHEVERLTAVIDRHRPSVPTASERWAARLDMSPNDFEPVDASEFICSAAEAAEILGLSVEHVHRLLERGTLIGERRRGRGGSIISRSSVAGLQREREARTHQQKRIA